MFEELSIYLDLVEKLGDPFTAFERIDSGESEEDKPGRHELFDPSPGRSEYGS